MAENVLLKSIQISLPGMVVTGVTGGVIGSFIGGLPWIFLCGMVGALVGMIVWRLGGQRFSLFVVIGALIGAMGTTLLAGTDAALIGAATGGAMGGFFFVNLKMLRS